MSDAERARAIYALCEQIREKVGDGSVDWQIHWIQTLALDALPVEERRNQYAILPINITGKCIRWKKPELPDWVRDVQVPD